MTKSELIKELKLLAEKFDGNLEQASKSMVLLTLQKKSFSFKITFNKRSGKLIADIRGLEIDYLVAPNFEEILDSIKFWLRD